MMTEDNRPVGSAPGGSPPKASRFGLGNVGSKLPRAKMPRAQKQPSAASANTASPLVRFKNWLVDSYKGLFKIVIQPQLPSLKQTIVLLLAFLFGMIWAYGIAPTQFFDAAPSQLSQAHRDQYIRFIAASYEAEFYTDDQIISLLQRVENPSAAVQRLIDTETGQVQAALQTIEPLAIQAGGGTSAPEGGNMLSSVITFVVAAFVFLIIVNVIALLWGLLIGGYVERFRNRLKPKSEADVEAAKVMGEIRMRRELEARMKQEAATDTTTSSFGPPLVQRISTYTKGRIYDDSFAIEDANDMFLGECGATIARSLGDRRDVAAVEVWLFDKEDFVKTLTKIFVTEHAYNDPVIRSELDPKVDNPGTDIVVLHPGAILTLDTKMLRLQAKVADVTMGSDPTLPMNSHIDALTLQLSAWETSGSAVPAAAVPTSMPADPFQSPSPQQPMPAASPAPYNPTPSPSPYQPAEPTQPTPASPRPFEPQQRPTPLPSTPPPAGGSSQPPPWPPAEDDNDDPFGGTGDFTPIGR